MKNQRDLFPRIDFHIGIRSTNKQAPQNQKSTHQLLDVRTCGETSPSYDRRAADIV